MEYLISFAKAIGMFVVGLCAFRLMGSQSVGRLTDFDLVVVIAIGALIGDALADPELNPWIIITAIAALVIMQIIISIIALKSPTFEKLVTGRSIMLIHNGKVLMNGLRKARITKNNLIQELRVKGIQDTDVTTIKEAYMEPNGKLSVVKLGTESDQ